MPDPNHDHTAELSSLADQDHGLGFSWKQRTDIDNLTSKVMLLDMKLDLLISEFRHYVRVCELARRPVELAPLTSTTTPALPKYTKATTPFARS